MRIVRTGEDQYQIEGLDRDTLKDIVKALRVYLIKAHEKGHYGYSFDRFIELIGTKDLERMKIKKAHL
jgi:hypothetical protein